MKYKLIATSAFGLESILVKELQQLGYQDTVVENGRVTFSGEEKDIALCNIWLRTADRLLIEAGRFPAANFEELFQGSLKIGWEDIIPVNGRMHVVGKTVRSKLSAISSCQAAVKRAIIEAMKRKHRLLVFPEDGPLYKIEVSILKDIASLTIDTSGQGLHKRGYRTEKGEAPLRETLAAGIVLLSGWKPDRILADPFCGSGTIAIEAALIGRNIAPGLKRDFASETWPHMNKEIWQSARDSAVSMVSGQRFRILASDSDYFVLKKARENAQRAGVLDCISFQKMPAGEFQSRKKYGYIVCNPPYGERMGEEAEMGRLYRTMGDTFLRLDSWSFFILTAYKYFEKSFGRTPTKNRKLYNGAIQCYLYEYFGPRPPRTMNDKNVFNV